MLNTRELARQSITTGWVNDELAERPRRELAMVGNRQRVQRQPPGDSRLVAPSRSTSIAGPCENATVAIVRNPDIAANRK